MVLIVEKGKINSNLINSSTFNKFGFGIPTLLDVNHLMNKVMNFDYIISNWIVLAIKKGL